MKENFKKLFAVVLAVAMLASQIVMPANAAGIYCKECGTDAVLGAELRRIEPTCGDVGYAIHDCENCDEGTITVKIPATGVHTGDGNVVPAVPSSCTAAGNVAYERCTGCGIYLDPVTGDVLDTIVDEMDPHSFTDTVTPPSCTEGGYTTKVCDECGKTETVDPTGALNHEFVDVEGKPATCKEEGYTAHKKCSRCGVIDEENPKEVIPVQDHNLHIDTQNSLIPNCTDDGFNLFVCENENCPYYEGNGGVKEPLSKLGHDMTTHAAKAANCEEAGNKAYYTCSRCDGIFKNKAGTSSYANLAATVVAAKGHTEIAIDYKAPTCTEEGAKDGVICVVCEKVLATSTPIPALGHELDYVDAEASTCFVNGHNAYAQCTVCEKYFAHNTDADDNVDAVALNYGTDINLPLREHDRVVREALAATCTEEGLTVTTCKYDDCNFVTSESIAALGHTFEHHDYEAPTCVDEGCKAYNECTRCTKLFADGANAADINIEAVEMDTLVIDANGHTEETVALLAPTYTAAGHKAGTKCSVCGEPLDGAEELAKLQQAVKFYYELAGVKCATTGIAATDAVNSGYVTLNVYFDVLADANDKAEYESDVLAEIYGIDFTINFNNAVFELTHVNDAASAFGNFAATPIVTANTNGRITVSQDTAGNINGMQFRGERNLLTTLTFQVTKEYKDDAGNYITGKDYDFTADWTVINPHDDVDAGVYNVDCSTSELTDKITVKMLGDANNSGTYSAADTLKISQFIKDNFEGDMYVAEYDLNKDGYINGEDLSLVRRAAAEDEFYKTIRVNPNEEITPEV